ncbi:MAG: hypothetical protein IJS00_00145 [Paludibacteraceae bacterium]|nr:hypothetical protein [Paludibacteraceae bacterium]
MKKLSLFLLLVLCLSVYADEKSVWKGSKAISWNTDVYAGEQFETPDGIFAGLKKDDVIKVAVEAKIDEPQYVMTYKAGADWTWTDLEGVSVSEGMMTYSVADDEIAGFIADRGIVFRGQGYDMTEIWVITNDENNPDDGNPDDNQPEDIEYEYTDVWTGDMAISWNQEVYAGSEFDTYTVEQDMLAGIAQGDEIKVSFAEAIADAQFALTYKAGDDWAWTDLTITQGNGCFTYRVASNEIAQDIADRGIVVRGQGYHLTAIAIGKAKNTTAIDETNDDIFNFNAQRYNLLGQKVGKDYRGIVILNGKKIMKQ